MTMTAKTIDIAGAGPAGLAAAITLARAGLTVDVYEKQSDVGKRFHGDLQGLENWSDEINVLGELDAMNIDINFDCDPLLELVITNGTRQRNSHYPAENPMGYLVKRGAFPGSLDYGLKEQAYSAGARLHFKETIPPEEADIVATGPISREIFAVDKGIIFRTDYPDTNIFLVNDDAAYKGYAYLLITGGYGCLCTVLFDRFDRLDACFQTTKAMFRAALPFTIEHEKPVAGIGSFSTKNIFQKGSALYVGEAAGLQDLMWGFGIRTAIRSGHLAAKCLIENRDYAREAADFFVPRQKATLTGRFVWEMVRFGNYSPVVNNRFRFRAGKAFDLKQFYQFGPANQRLYPLARRYMQRRFPNLRL
jgi:flavin-dependent dehydrogenase